MVLIVDEKLRMGESRRAALNNAMEKFQDAQYFLWVEPEKDGLITADSLNVMLAGLRENQTDIVVPRRKSKESMPKLQAWMESRANKRASSLQGSELEETMDLWFGPKMFNRKGAAYFANYRGSLDKWDAVIKPVIKAHGQGARISSAEVDYSYDPSQSESERDDRQMKQKRLVQYSQILAELGDEFWKNKIKEKE